MKVGDRHGRARLNHIAHRAIREKLAELSAQLLHLCGRKVVDVGARYLLVCCLGGYLPKGIDVSTYSQAKLNALARRLNERPSKTLDFQTPAEMFSQIVASTG